MLTRLLPGQARSSRPSSPTPFATPWASRRSSGRSASGPRRRPVRLSPPVESSFSFSARDAPELTEECDPTTLPPRSRFLISHSRTSSLHRVRPSHRTHGTAHNENERSNHLDLRPRDRLVRLPPPPVDRPLPLWLCAPKRGEVELALRLRACVKEEEEQAWSRRSGLLFFFSSQLASSPFMALSFRVLG